MSSHRRESELLEHELDRVSALIESTRDDVARTRRQRERAEREVSRLREQLSRLEGEELRENDHRVAGEYRSREIEKRVHWLQDQLDARHRSCRDLQEQTDQMKNEARRKEAQAEVALRRLRIVAGALGSTSLLEFARRERSHVERERSHTEDE